MAYKRHQHLPCLIPIPYVCISPCYCGFSECGEACLPVGISLLVACSLFCIGYIALVVYVCKGGCQKTPTQPGTVIMTVPTQGQVNTLYIYFFPITSEIPMNGCSLSLSLTLSLSLSLSLSIYLSISLSLFLSLSLKQPFILCRLENRNKTYINFSRQTAPVNFQ